MPKHQNKFFFLNIFHQKQSSPNRQFYESPAADYDGSVFMVYTKTAPVMFTQVYTVIVYNFIFFIQLLTSDT